MQNSAVEHSFVARRPSSPARWSLLVWFGLLVVLCYAKILQALASIWQTNEDMGHGFLVPLIAAYIVWLKRDHLAQLTAKPNKWGLVLVLYSCLQLTVAQLGAEAFLARTSLVLCIIGIVWYLGGTEILRELAFPLFLLFFMIPLPQVLYNEITFPLQLFASSVAEHVLSFLGIPVYREGNIIELASQRLSVVEACSGIRSLLSLTFLSLIYGFFFLEKDPWSRLILFLLTIPIAIFTNSLRVTVTGILSEYNPELARGVFHSMEGWVVFVIALVLLFLAHRMIILVKTRISAPPPPPPAAVTV